MRNYRLTTIPMSLRTFRGEIAYHLAKRRGTLIPLNDEPPLREWKHWKLIANRFPYSSVFVVHDMLIPKRTASKYSELTEPARKELRQIIDGYGQANYHMVFENMSSKRSIMTLYHLHLVRYRSRRRGLAGLLGLIGEWRSKREVPTRNLEAKGTSR